MPVIINDFEVVVEAPTPDTQPVLEGVAQPPVPAPLLTPEDIRSILRYQLERLERVWAH